MLFSTTINQILHQYIEDLDITNIIADYVGNNYLIIPEYLNISVLLLPEVNNIIPPSAVQRMHPLRRHSCIFMVIYK